MKRSLGLKTKLIVLFLSLLKVKFVLVHGQEEENLNLFDRWIEWSDGKNMLVHYLNKQAFAYLDCHEGYQ